MTIKKPKLLLFRSIRSGLPTFVLDHFEDHEDCLRQNFDLVVAGDAVCDLDELCDRHRPDLLMFESGVYAGERSILNAGTHGSIPRIGLCNADGYCPSRSIFLSDMDRWGVETFFTHAVSMPAYTPCIADRLYLWPNFVNPKRFPYPLARSKDIPVLLTGSRASHYPWRNAISRILAEQLPATVSPHFGWFDAHATSAMVVGSAYVQQLSRSIFVPACGSIANEVVRKHFEVPAAGACLITQKTPFVEAAGFRDMENCIFAEEGDVLDKVKHCLDNPTELSRIVRAGRELVSQRHAIDSRSQIADWFALQRQQRDDQRIIQRDPFSPLELESDSHNQQLPSADNCSLQPILIRNGFVDLAEGKPSEARAKFTRSNNWHFTSEAALGIARSYLDDGKPMLAIDTLWRIVSNELSMNAIEPDPVEWATFIRAWLCAGQLKKARLYSEIAPWIRHHELDRMRRLVDCLANLPPRAFLPERPRQSINDDEKLSFSEWRSQMADDLNRSRQPRLSKQVLAIEFRDEHLDRIHADHNRRGQVASEATRQMQALWQGHRRNLPAIVRNFIARADGPPKRELPTAIIGTAMRRLGFKTPEVNSVCASLAATADYQQIALNGVSRTSPLADAILASAALNPSLNYAKPFFDGSPDLPAATRHFSMIGGGRGSGVDTGFLIDRAEVVVLSDVLQQSQGNLLEMLEASGRFARIEIARDRVDVLRRFASAPDANKDLVRAGAYQVHSL